MNRKHVLTKTR